MCDTLCMQVFKRLSELGWTVEDSDFDVVMFGVEKTYDYILNFCNLDELPPELFNTAVDMAVGEFIMDKYSTDDISGYYNGELVKTISEGDISITYDREQASKSLERLVDKLMEGKNMLYAFRRLKW